VQPAAADLAETGNTPTSPPCASWHLRYTVCDEHTPVATVEPDGSERFLHTVTASTGHGQMWEEPPCVSHRGDQTTATAAMPQQLRVEPVNGLTGLRTVVLMVR
jgi:hypothetical protein